MTIFFLLANHSLNQFDLLENLLKLLEKMGMWPERKVPNKIENITNFWNNILQVWRNLFERLIDLVW